MELKTFLDQVKWRQKQAGPHKGHDIREKLTLSVLQIEESTTEVGDQQQLIDQLGDVLLHSFINMIEHKVPINDTSPDLDLDRWKNEIRRYKLVNRLVTTEVYLYTLRNTLKNFLQSEDTKMIKAFLLELVIKTFLYIDYLNLSIDAVLDQKMEKIGSEIKNAK